MSLEKRTVFVHEVIAIRSSDGWLAHDEGATFWSCDLNRQHETFAVAATHSLWQLPMSRYCSRLRHRLREHAQFAGNILETRPPSGATVEGKASPRRKHRHRQTPNFGRRPPLDYLRATSCVATAPALVTRTEFAPNYPSRNHDQRPLVVVAASLTIGLWHTSPSYRKRHVRYSRRHSSQNIYVPECTGPLPTAENH